jgi:hypothetical protein
MKRFACLAALSALCLFSLAGNSFAQFFGHNVAVGAGGIAVNRGLGVRVGGCGVGVVGARFGVNVGLQPAFSGLAVQQGFAVQNIQQTVMVPQVVNQQVLVPTQEVVAVQQPFVGVGVGGIGVNVGVGGFGFNRFAVGGLGVGLHGPRTVVRTGGVRGAIFGTKVIRR